jgi:hypothetical protein
MAEIAHVSLAHELKLFGHRVWELSPRIDAVPALAPAAEALRHAVAEAPRRIARAGAAEGRRAKHELHCAFRALARAVELLDRVARESEALAVEALALAQEGAELSHSIYERVA